MEKTERIPKKGEEVFSKNGTEYSCWIEEVRGTKVLLRYGQEHNTVHITELKVLDDIWELPNWSTDFEIDY